MMAKPRAGWMDARGPLSLDELGHMRIGEIVDFLGRWKPRPPDFFAMTMDSAGAFAEDLRADVARRPSEYADSAAQLRGLAPVYARAIVGGLADATRNGLVFVWSNVLDLISWYVGQPRVVNDHRVVSADDSTDSWLHVRLTALDLLENAMNQGSMPFESEENVGGLLELLSRDPSPSPEDDADYPADVDRWLATAAGTVRSRAIRVLVTFAFWTKSEAAKKLLFAVFEERMRDDDERSPTVRFAMGNVFVRLLVLDAAWARRHARALFDGPLDSALPTWAGYLHDGVSGDSSKLLETQYERAVATLDGSAKPSRIDELLAQHLALLYAHGQKGLEPDGLIARFFETASEDLRYHFHHSAAASAQRAGADPTVIDRLRAVWEWRVGQGASRRELAAFESWFRMGIFPDEWALDQLTRAGEIGVRFRGYMMIVNDDITKLWPSHAQRVMAATRAITEAETDFVQINAARQGLQRLVSAGVASDDEVVRREARRIANIVAARALPDFKIYV